MVGECRTRICVAWRTCSKGSGEPPTTLFVKLHIRGRLQLPLAPVQVKLLLKICLGIPGSSERGHGSFELLAAEGADAHDGCGTEPFDHPQSPLCNAHRNRCGG